MNQPAPVNAASMYAGIQDAKTDTRYPWISQPGRYLVKTLGWRAQKNFSGKFADVWDIEIIHTYRGGHNPEEKLTRMRVQDQFNTWLNEVKTRAVTMLTLINNGEPVAANSVGVEHLTAITEGNGSMFFGVPVVIELLPPQPTKQAGKEFAPLHYYIPTPADLQAAGLGG